MDEVLRQKTLNVVKMLLGKVRGRLLATDVRGAAFTLYNTVLPTLAGLADNPAEASQLTMEAQLALENCLDMQSGPRRSVFIDWKVFDEAVRFLDKTGEELPLAILGAIERFGAALTEEPGKRGGIRGGSNQ